MSGSDVRLEPPRIPPTQSLEFRPRRHSSESGSSVRDAPYFRVTLTELDIPDPAQPGYAENASTSALNL